MKKNRSIALGLSVALAAGAAVARVVPSLSDRLVGVGSYYGDAQGRIPISTSTGGVMYVAVSAAGQCGFSIYTAGDSVANDATLAVCGIGRAGALVGCDPAYGEALLYGLEDVQGAASDPSEMTAECQVLFGTTCVCKLAFRDGGAFCYTCSRGACAKSQC